MKASPQDAAAASCGWGSAAVVADCGLAVYAPSVSGGALLARAAARRASTSRATRSWAAICVCECLHAQSLNAKFVRYFQN